MISNMTARLAFRLTLNHILYITFLMEIWHNLSRKIVTKKKITFLIAKNIYLLGSTNNHKLYKKTAFNYFLNYYQIIQKLLHCYKIRLQI